MMKSQQSLEYVIKRLICGDSIDNIAEVITEKKLEAMNSEQTIGMTQASSKALNHRGRQPTKAPAEQRTQSQEHEGKEDSF